MNSSPGLPSAALRDLWTTAPEYRSLYQSEDEVRSIVSDLDMPGATALADIGCGNGVFAIAAAQANPRCQVWAFDALESAVVVRAASATEQLGDGGISARVAPAERIPLEDASVDRVLCRAVLHHLPEPQRVYREIARVLARDGRLLLQAPCNYWEKPWSRIIADLYAFDDDSHPRYYHQPAEVIDALNAAGLAMRSARSWRYPHQNLKPRQVEFIQQKGAQDRFQLRQESDGTWSCALYWLRVIAARL